MSAEDAVRERIRRFLVEEGETGGRGEIPDDLYLLDGILDSVGLTKLVAMIEGELGVEIGIDDMRPETFATVASISAFVLASTGP